MYIQHLQVQNSRVIEHLSFELDPHLNFIVGGNGAGKTTILEAIHILGTGKSFRHKEMGPFIRYDKKYARIISRLKDHNGTHYTFAIERHASGFQARFQGNPIRKRSELLKILPLQVVLPSSHALVEDGPELRRRFLDYGLFHVEPGYHAGLNRYMRHLNQYNQALKVHNDLLAKSFLPGLAELGKVIHQHRVHFVKQLWLMVERCLEQMNWKLPIKMEYRSGWKRGASLWEELNKHHARALQIGYCTKGPHRAQLDFYMEGKPAKTILSRGQQKMLVYALSIAVIQLLRKTLDYSPILLIDDLDAELDRENVQSLMNYLLRLPVQKIITRLDVKNPLQGTGRMFHVEHGRCITFEDFQT